MTIKKCTGVRPISLRTRQNTKSLSAQKTTLALGVSALMLSPSLLAQEETIELDTMQIEDRTIDTNPYAEPGAPYKARVSGDDRHVKPLAETPQTITVLTETQIQESGRSDLREILQAQPGITIGTGENGNAFGDRYIIRGHEARSDVFVDGLRDPGMTTRESFATEQLEITKGPSSTFAGRGSTGGAINSVTKQASTEYNFAEIQAGVGTDDYRRFTLDTNQVFSDTVAVRANILNAYEEVPDRAPAERIRRGAALSGAFEATDKLSIVADYYYLKAKDKPDLGTYIVSGGGEPVDDIPVYLQDEDFLESTVSTYTLGAGYEFSDTLRLQNAMRYGTTTNGYVTTGANGAVRSSSDVEAPGEDTITLSAHHGWQEVEYFADQLNLFVDMGDKDGIYHQWVFGVEYTELKVLNGTYDVDEVATNCTTVRGLGERAAHCIIDGDGNLIPDVNSFLYDGFSKGDSDSDYQIETISYSVMDTIDIYESLTLFLGARYDRFDYSNLYRDEYFTYTKGLWNSHVGTVYNINEQGNVYFTYSTSSNINGGESDVGGSCGYGGVCGLSSKPESTVNLELGTKWNLFNQKLLASLAVFQITKDDVLENVGNDYESLGTFNTGKNRVKGVELSLVGNVTDKLSAQFGLAVMDSEILDSYKEENIGRVLSNFADDSAFLQLRYQLIDDFAFGGTVTYSSEMYSGQPDTAAGWNEVINDYSYTVPSYTTFDIFATYDITDDLNARLNVQNATDEDYYLAAYRSGSFTYIGDARRAMLTFTYQM